MSQPVVRVMFVCAGNTCRSPMAEALLRHRIQADGLDAMIEVASAGVRADVGAVTNPAAVAVLLAHGITFSSYARQFESDDWMQQDLIVALDWKTLRGVRRLRADVPKVRANAHLLLDFARGVNETEVFDPYGTERYGEALALIERGVDGLFTYLRKEYRL